jgi:hypothetical protein
METMLMFLVGPYEEQIKKQKKGGNIMEKYLGHPILTFLQNLFLIVSVFCFAF